MRRWPRLALPLLFNYLGSAWTAIVGIVFLPLFIRHLGLEGFALVGLYITALSLAILLDFGLSTMANRRLGARGDNAPALLRGAEFSSWLGASIAAASCAVILPATAGMWLQPVDLPADQLHRALMLLGPAAIATAPGALYTGALYGCGLNGQVNLLLALFATARWAGGVAIAGPADGGIDGFLWWQAGVNLASSLTLGAAAWRAVGGFTQGWPQWPALRAELRFTGAAGLIAATGLLLTQFDRLILPRAVPLDQFGAYVLAALVAAAPARFSAPMFSALLPRLTALVEDGAALAGVMARASSLLAALSFAAAAGLSWLGEPLLGWWSGDEKTTALAMTVMPCLAYGSAFNACSVAPATLLLARGRTRLMVGINLAWVVLQPIALIELVTRFGLAAAGWVWLALNASYILLLGPAALAGQDIGFGRWLGGALLWPAIAAMPAAWLAARYLPVQDHSWQSMAWISLGGLACLVCAGAAGMVWLRWNRWHG